MTFSEAHEDYVRSVAIAQELLETLVYDEFALGDIRAFKERLDGFQHALDAVILKRTALSVHQKDNDK